MPVNPLPPQAYTKDTLQKAYSWLLSQAPSVKEMAQDQNMLVSLYLKAQRNGDVVLETPSIQNFKQELKSLAHMMGDFHSPQQMAAASLAQVPNQSSTPAQAPLAPAFHAQPQQTQAHMTAQASVTPAQTMAGFDQKTLEALQQVRETFNLSSDTEALRALVALGIKQFRKSNF